MKSILLIIDPDQTNHSALDKANYIANLTGADIRLLLCLPEPRVNSHGTVNEADIKDTIVKMEENNLQHMCARMDQVAGIVKTQIVFSKPVIDGLIQQIEMAAPDIVIKESDHQPSIKRTLFSNTDWQLIRRCPAPLLLTKSTPWHSEPRITVAVDPIRHNDQQTHQQLAQALIRTGLEWQTLAKSQLTLFHSIDTDILLNSYMTPSHTFVEQLKTNHRQSCEQLLDEFSLSEEQLVLKEGKLENNLPIYADETKIDLVIMGVVSYNPLERMLIGSSAEKVLDRVGCDMLLLKP